MMPFLSLCLFSLLSSIVLLPLFISAAAAPGTLLFTYPPVGANYSFNVPSQLSVAPVLTTSCPTSPLLYVADRANNRIVAIDSNTGLLLQVYTNSGNLSQPSQAVSDGSSLYITEASNPPRITKLDLVSGVQQAQYYPAGSSLYGLGVDAVNHFVYATVFLNSGPGVCQKLRTTDLGLVANISAAFYPIAVAVAGGNVYQTDVRAGINTTVQVFSVNYPNPTTITTVYDHTSLVTSTYGLAVDSAGNIYQNDAPYPGTHRIVAFAPNGTQLLAINISALTSLLGAPFGVAVDCQGNIYASDDSSRVWKFQGLALPTTSAVSGDPSFTGLRGQRYQVHGMDGSVYALISDSQVQVNAEFGFLSSGECLRDEAGHSIFTCWSHPGSYLTALSIRTPTAALNFTAGPALSGFSQIAVEGAGVLQVREKRVVGGMTINYRDLRTVVVRGAGLFDLEVQNSDGFLNLMKVEVREMRELREEVRSHGLLGQTWREGVKGEEVEEVEGRVDDYVVEDGLMGCHFFYTQHTC